MVLIIIYNIKLIIIISNIKLMIFARNDIMEIEIDSLLIYIDSKHDSNLM